MSWKMAEKPKTVLASQSLVKEFVDMEPAPYDRPLSERRLMVYERILKAGHFRPVTWASAICYETNCTYRVNGKHTSIMLSKLDKLPDFYVTIERWNCETLKDVGSLYNTYDSAQASRNSTDINMAFAATMPELRGVPIRVINLVVSASSYLKWDETTRAKVPQAERAEELLDRVDFVEWIQKVVGGATNRGTSLEKHLSRVPVACAMLATYDRAPQVSLEFWKAVRDESDPNNMSPSRKLARFLVRAAMAGGQISTGHGKKMVTHRGMFVKCIHAWNAFREGVDTNLNYHATSPIPKVSN